MKGRRRTVVAPGEGVIFTVSYTQQKIALPYGTGGGATPLYYTMLKLSTILMTFINHLTLYIHWSDEIDRSDRINLLAYSWLRYQDTGGAAGRNVRIDLPVGSQVEKYSYCRNALLLLVYSNPTSTLLSFPSIHP